MFTERELYWLSGLLEGEGSFLVGSPSYPNLPKIQLHMTDEDIVVKVAALFGTKAVPIKKSKHDLPHWKPTWMAVVRGSRAVEVMGQLKPLMGVRRQEQIDRALACYEIKERGYISREQVISIRELLGQGHRVCDIARQLNINRRVIGRIKNGKTYKDKRYER